MKLWHSFTKEILLATRGFYFYVEIAMAGIFLFLLLFVIPENIDSKTDEYFYFDGPTVGLEIIQDELILDDVDHQVEIVELELDGEIYQATLYESDNSLRYLLDDLDAAIGLADNERAFGAIIHMNEEGQVTYTYYLQGYETQRLRNTFAVFHNESMDNLKVAFDDQEVRALHNDQVLLNDRENVVPSFLTFNGSLMGMFIIASYIFLDKKEGVIKAYAITTSPVWQYLLSKVAVVTVTSIITSIIITVPVMGGQPNYLAMFIFLLSTGFAASSLGLVLASFYDDIVQAFGMIFVLFIAFLLPNIAYFIPTWDPSWIQFIPSYSMLEGFKEILLPGSDLVYIMVVSLGFLIAGLVLFFFANKRFKKTLSI